MIDTLLANGAVWFTGAALIGTGVFFIKLVMMLFFGSDGDAPGMDHAGGHVGGHDSVHDGHADTVAGLLSIQGAAAFSMGFGWAGLLGRSGLGFDIPASIGMGLAGGAIMCAVLLVLLRGMRSMESSGNVQLSKTLDAEGEIYADVPAAGTGRGQLRLVTSGRMRIVQAIAADGQPPIPTGSRAKVVRVNPDNSVTVVRV